MKADKNSTNQTITLEQLLRLKRAEKPEDAFWDRFDSELHGRMLRTLVNSDSKSTGLIRWLRMRWLQAGAVAACVVLFAVFAVDLHWQEQVGTDNPTVVALEPGLPEVSQPTASLSASASTTAVESETTVERTDFGIGRVASAKPLSEASFSRDFGANSVRVAMAAPIDSYRMDYASDSVFAAQSARGRLVY
jgi:hypothetical protein